MTLVAGNAATSIHDFELALIGETSENVPAALGAGQFGMAYEFAYINMALSVGNQQKLGYGETLAASSAMRRFVSRFWRWWAKEIRLAAAPSRDERPGRLLSPENSLHGSCRDRHGRD